MHSNSATLTASTGEGHKQGSLLVHSHLSMEQSREQLPLSRDGNGQVHLMATGPVKIYVDYQGLLGSGGQGTVFRANVFDDSGTRLLLEVRIYR